MSIFENCIVFATNGLDYYFCWRNLNHFLNRRPICCKKRTNKQNKSAKVHIGVVFAAFHDSNLEKNYLHRPDYIIKYTALLVWIIGCCLIYIQLATNELNCILCIVIDISVFLFLTAVLALCWYKKFCFWKSKGEENQLYSRFSCRIFNFFEKTQQSLRRRIVLYLMVVCSFLMVTSLILVSIL